MKKEPRSSLLGNNSSIWKSAHRIYDTLSSPVTFVVYSLLIVICVIFDFIQEPYCNPILEHIFEPKNPAAILDTSLVIWSFATALIIFYLEKTKERFYGVGLYEVLLKNKNDSTFMLASKMVFFALSLAFLALAAAYEWSITLTFLGALQLVLMLYAFLMVCIETSEQEVRKKIFEEVVLSIKDIYTSTANSSFSDNKKLFANIHSNFTEKARSYLYIKILKNISFSKAQDIDVFLNFIESATQEEQWKHFSKEDCATTDKEAKEKKCIFMYFSYILASVIILYCRNPHTRNNLFYYIYGKISDCQKYQKYMMYGFATCLIMNFDTAKSDFDTLINSIVPCQTKQQRTTPSLYAKQCAREIVESPYNGSSPSMNSFLEEWPLCDAKFSMLPEERMSSSDKSLFSGFFQFLNETDIIASL